VSTYVNNKIPCRTIGLVLSQYQYCVQAYSELYQLLDFYVYCFDSISFIITDRFRQWSLYTWPNHDNTESRTCRL